MKNLLMWIPLFSTKILSLLRSLCVLLSFPKNYVVVITLTPTLALDGIVITTGFQCSSHHISVIILTKYYQYFPSLSIENCRLRQISQKNMYFNKQLSLTRRILIILASLKGLRLGLKHEKRTTSVWREQSLMHVNVVVILFFMG